MRILRRIAVIALVVILQLSLVMHFTCPPINAAKTSFRRAERASAWEALARNRTPENEAAFRQEVRLATQHVSAQQLTLTGVVLAGILAFEGLLIYLGKKHVDKYKAVP